MHPTVDEDLGIINQSLQSISFSSDFEIYKLNPFQKSKLDNQLVEYLSSSSTSLNYHEEHNEDRTLEKQLPDIENEFQNICSNHNLIKDKIFKENLIQTNNLKIKQSHSKERDNQLSPIHIKTYTYDGDLINTQNCKFEGNLVGSLPCIKFTNMKDFEQPHVPRNMIGKNVLFFIKYFF